MKPDTPEGTPMVTQAVVTREKVAEYLKAFGLVSQLSTQEADQFISIAQEFQLNPFKREIHCVPYGEGQYRKLSIVIGYETYIKRAERTGKLDGWKAWTEGDAGTMKAVVEIYRKDWHQPFRHEVPWSEAAQKRKDGTLTPFWQKMPCFQLKKVAISQAFRLAFPDELGGMPYAADELGIDQMPPGNSLTDDMPKDGPPVQTRLPETSPVALANTAPTPEAKVSSPSLPVKESPQVEPDPFTELTRFLDEHDEAFTASHREWIEGQVSANHSPEKAQHMLRYAQRKAREYEETADGDPYNIKRYRMFTTSPVVRMANQRRTNV